MSYSVPHAGFNPGSDRTTVTGDRCLYMYSSYVLPPFYEYHVYIQFDINYATDEIYIVAVSLD